MRKQLILVNQFPESQYNSEKAWETFVNESQWYNEKDTFVVNYEEDQTGRWFYIYKII